MIIHYDARGTSEEEVREDARRTAYRFFGHSDWQIVLGEAEEEEYEVHRDSTTGKGNTIVTSWSCPVMAGPREEMQE